MIEHSEEYKLGYITGYHANIRHRWHTPPYLPQKDGEYIVTVKTMRKKFVTTDEYDADEMEWMTFDNEYDKGVVIAWSKLPKPCMSDGKRKRYRKND